MYNYRTYQEEEINPEELPSVAEERGRDFIPRIALGSGIMDAGPGPAVGLYEVLVAQDWKPIDALEEVLRTLIKGRPTDG